MNIINIRCPNCGGPVRFDLDVKETDCPFCRSHLYFDDGNRTITYVNIIRDEARLKEAENERFKLEHDAKIEEIRAKHIVRTELKKAKIEAKYKNKSSNPYESFRNVLKLVWLISFVLHFYLLQNYKAVFMGITFDELAIYDLLLHLFLGIYLLLTHWRKR